MEDRKRGTFIERNDWKVWVGLCTIIALFGLSDMQAGGATFEGGEVVMFTGITGTTWDALQVRDPGVARLIDSQVRSGGALLVLVGLLSLAVTLAGLRHRHRWAWLTMWLWPLWIAWIVITGLLIEKEPGAGIPVPVISGSIFLVITVALQALSYRKYRTASPA